MPTFADVSWPLRTERLVVRPCRVEDAEAAYALRRHPDVAPWVHSLPTDLGSWRERFRDPEVQARALTLEHDGQVAGELMVAVRDGPAQHEVAAAAHRSEAEVGWLVDPALRGRGLATEAGRALLDLCFGPLGVRRVVASTFEVNTASWRVMEKLGMRLEARTVRDALHRDHGWLDSRVHALLAEEWTALREG